MHRCGSKPGKRWERWYWRVQRNAAGVVGGEGTGMGQGVEGEAKWEEEGKNVVVGRRREREGKSPPAL